jgi:hypothetical protein
MSERERTLRHPENPKLCGCVKACFLTKTEARRKRVVCRYRGYEVATGVYKLKS